MTKITILLLSLVASLPAWGVVTLDGTGNSTKYVFEVNATYSWEGLKPETKKKCMAIIDGKLYSASDDKQDCKNGTHNFKRIKNTDNPIISEGANDTHSRIGETDHPVVEEVYVHLNEDGTPIIKEVNKDRPIDEKLHGQHEGPLTTTTTTQPYYETFTVNQEKVCEPTADKVVDTSVAAPTEVAIKSPDAAAPEEKVSNSGSVTTCDITDCNNMNNEVCRDGFLSDYCAQNQDGNCPSKTCMLQYSKLKDKLKPYDDKITQAENEGKASLAAADGPRSKYNAAKVAFEESTKVWKEAQTQWKKDQSTAFADHRKALHDKNNYLTGQLKNNFTCIVSDGKNPNFKNVALIEKQINSCENPGGKGAAKKHATTSAQVQQ